MSDLARQAASGGSFTLTGVPDGAEAFAAAEIARALHQSGADRPALAVIIARDGPRQQMILAGLAFTAPEAEVLSYPAWDCQPYDRASPNASIAAQRMAALSRLAGSRGGERPRIVVTTVNAVLQRTPPLAWVSRQSLSAAPGNRLKMNDLAAWLEINGYVRASTVRDTGEYALRGGILDLYPPGLAEPIRFDFFGDTLESIKAFDPETQRSHHALRSLDLVPVTEFQLTSEAIKRFRQGYAQQFGAPGRDDLLYAAVSEGRKFPGMEHWLPLFHGGLDTLMAYTPGAALIIEPLAEAAASERLKQIADYHDARRQSMSARDHHGAPYKPLPRAALYLGQAEWDALLARETVIRLTPFDASQSPGLTAVGLVALGGRKGRIFAAERADQNANVFDAAAAHIRDLQGQGRRVIAASWSGGARDRLIGVIADHGFKAAKPVASLAAARALKAGDAAFAVLPLESGFDLGDLSVIAEQDILGERMARPKRASRKAQDFIAEAGSLAPGDFVVHVDHGIARFAGLRNIEAAGAPHDCLELHYAGGDKLFLPVENIELLSRYGSEETEAPLDRLGGAGWQTRKSRLKQRIRDMARQLMKIAAARALREAPRFAAPAGLYDEFAARFPYDETDDQQAAIDAVLDDLASGKPMDRLICGDVGFGKTEVALRAAFVAVMAGKQAAVVVPTTLLARQHFKTFSERFHGLPLTVAHASRLVSAADLKKMRDGLAAGHVDIVVGTHALLGKQIQFKDLGLVVIDEEQHFGVAHKERLKALRSEVHVLTLSATPIPRTLQLALTGVRELSLMATPPVDRLAVRSFVTPFDPLVVREALLRERYRGGQSFYVCPRIEDIAEVKAFLDANVPEVKTGIGHGQIAPGELESVMSDFYDGKFDVLLSTAIVESGLDIPRANTLIVHRADMFGLAQLYQLRGRVGRSKTRAYALFTLPVNRTITLTAERRLKVLQSLDTLGAGFQLASHDLDIRGAGNLLGEEQSGHIREVGYELYQQMLQDAVAALKAGVEEPAEEQWSPVIAVGAPVTIPESYVSDIEIRMGLYRRLAHLQDDSEIDAFAAELVDRFGPLPPEAGHLMRIVAIKVLCRNANIEKVEAGPKGIVVSFRGNSFANPGGLVAYVAGLNAAAKVRPDMRVVFSGNFETVEARLADTRRILSDIARIAKRGK